MRCSHSCSCAWHAGGGTAAPSSQPSPWSAQLQGPLELCLKHLPDSSTATANADLLIACLQQCPSPALQLALLLGTLTRHAQVLPDPASGCAAAADSQPKLTSGNDSDPPRPRTADVPPADTRADEVSPGSPLAARSASVAQSSAAGRGDESSAAWLHVAESAEPATRVEVACLIIQRLVTAGKGVGGLLQWQSAELDEVACSLVSQDGLAPHAGAQQVWAW